MAMDQRNSGSASSALEPDSGLARYTSLGDYLRVIRRRKVLIALVTIAVTAAAIGYSLTRTPTYEASAQLSFQDPLQTLEFIDSGGGSRVEPPGVRAASNAELIRSPEVTRRVARRLEASAPRSELQDAISTTIGQQTQIVTLTARWSDAEFAAELANAYARIGGQVREQAELDRIADAVRATRDDLREAEEADLPSAFRITVLESQLSRVQTVRAVAEPVEVLTRATVPSDPVAPDTTRNGIFGAAFGLLLALMLAFLRESLDRRLNSVQDVHQELDLPVLGRVTDVALGYPGLVRNDGLRMLESDFEAFRVLRMNIAALPAEPGIRTLLVTSAMPEEGKSTVSLSLASAAAATGQRVLLAECDLRRPVFARRLGLQRTPGLSDYLLGKAEPQEVLQVAELVEPLRVNGGKKSTDQDASAGSLVCITAGSEVTQPAELLMGPRFDSFLDKVSRAYDLVILDSSPLLAVVDPLELVSRVDSVILCVRVHSTTREQLRAAQAALRHLPERPTGAVVTGIRRSDGEVYEYYSGY